VVGVLPGSDPELKNEYIVLSAHLDHLGVGEPIRGDRINNGAIDNASGIGSILEIARELHDSKVHLKRSVLFLAVTAEEKGLLGSAYFAGNPTVPQKSLVANINIDMFMPIHAFRSVMVLGLDESTLGTNVRAAAKADGLAVQGDLEPDRNRFIRSDQYNFIRNGIPALALKVGYEKGSPEEKLQNTWLKERYHAPSDDLNQPVDLEAAAGFNRFMLKLVEQIANQDERPRWHQASFFRRFAK
jgi:Zn-dependent M28 family amino/carboxypeptidase